MNKEKILWGFYLTFENELIIIGDIKNVLEYYKNEIIRMVKDET